MLTELDLKIIDKEITILKEDKNFRYYDYWSQYKTCVKHQYTAWKEGRKHMEEKDLLEQSFLILTRKENFNLEQFKEDFYKLKIKELTDKYKTQNITISRAAKHIGLNPKKRIGGQYEKAKKFINDFVLNHYQDLSNLTMFQIMEKYKISKYIYKKLIKVSKNAQKNIQIVS